MQKLASKNRRMSAASIALEDAEVEDKRTFICPSIHSRCICNTRTTTHTYHNTTTTSYALPQKINEK